MNDLMERLIVQLWTPNTTLLYSLTLFSVSIRFSMPYLQASYNTPPFLASILAFPRFDVETFRYYTRLNRPYRRLLDMADMIGEYPPMINNYLRPH